MPVCLFVTLVYCGRTVGWIKMKLDMQVGLGPAGHIVLDGDRAILPQRGTAPNFWLVYCGLTGGWIKIPLGTKLGLDPGHVMLDGDPAPPKKGTDHIFRPMIIVAKRLDGSRYHLVRR